MARRRGKKIATTAVARKLLTRAFHLLRQAEQEQALPGSGPAKASTVTATASATRSPRPTRSPARPRSCARCSPRSPQTRA
jgi:hypothetical protein